MKKLLVITVILLINLSLFGCDNAEKTVGVEKKSISENLISNIMLLPEIRELGSEGEREACFLLCKVLSDCNYDIELQKINYALSENGIAIEQSKVFPVNLKKIKDGETNNIIAKDKQYTFSNKDIIITAHYDTTGFPGANDNASGVSVLLELAENVNKPKKYNLIFILFTGEENLLLGSEYYVNNLSEKEKSNITAVINLDTLSGDCEPEITFAKQEYNEAYAIFEDAFKKYFTVNLAPPYSGGDEISFGNAGIPSLSIGQEGNDLHSYNDTYNNLNINNLVKVYTALKEGLEKLP